MMHQRSAVFSMCLGIGLENFAARRFPNRLTMALMIWRFAFSCQRVVFFPFLVDGCEFRLPTTDFLVGDVPNFCCW